MSNVTRWTPGPWSPTTTPAGKGKVVDDKGFSVANCTGSSYQQQVIDSHLIAAAPELYAALDMLMDATGPGDAEQLLAEERKNIMALLAKARGEQS